MVNRMGEDALRHVQELADLAVEALKAHGFNLASEGSGGLVVEVDAGDDEAGGVYIKWKSPLSISSKVTELIRSQNLESPFLAQATQYSSGMQKALSNALSLSGFLVELEDDLRPFGIRVVSRG
ncbi:hypothetical protein [Streptomyces sp. NBC_00996]|uniref:hypothetical protein n=1 Tax=Streptomyces sp. NBC_00996 TaxID=2903710 RepID=UPI00386A87D4|nr:hypothetical protein OG390_35750 [Streptomyces sp. NBC_00996]